MPTVDEAVLYAAIGPQTWVYALADYIAQKTASTANLAASTSYDNDTAAAAGGVAIGALYRNGNFVMVRLT